MPSSIITQFYADAQAAIDELLYENPTLATSMGDHRYDNRLGDLSPEGILRQRAQIGRWLTVFNTYAPSTWPVDSRIDLILIKQLFVQVIRNFDKLRLPRRYPGAGTDECLGGVYTLIIKEFAPLPERLKSILGRLRDVPRVLASSRAPLEAQAVPPVWAQIALESAQQGIGLFSGMIPALAEAAPELKDDLIAAGQEAATALTEHATWIEKEVIPHAQGEFAVGKEIFDEMLREDHMVGYEADQLLATGWRLFDETKQQMVAVAAQIDPSKTASELLEEAKRNHPAANELLDTYRQWMAKARQFVVDHAIATIPPGESIRIEPTPPFQRMLIPYAAYMMPGFFEKVQEGIFWVTPMDENADPESVERKLRGHPLADIPVTALHEAYPGHHLQLVVSNTSESLPRKLGAFMSTLFIEGWAFYCEELMEQLGFIDQPIQKLARLQAQLWRAARIILDPSLHTGKMTVDEGIQFLVERAGLEPDDAKAEVRRYTQSPTQPQSYLMGKLQILEIVAEYKRRSPNASMLQMHDDILRGGSLPPRLMRLRLFGA